MTWQIVLTILCGGLIGLSLGTVGSGGSLLGIPLMVYMLGATAQRAAMMSLVLVGLTSWVGVWEHARNGTVQVKSALMFCATGALGAWGGAQGHRMVQEEVILLLFGVLLLLASILLPLQSGSLYGAVTPSGRTRVSRYGWKKLASIGFGIGLLTGFFGVGGGFLIVPALVLVLGLPGDAAVGTALLIVALLSLAGVAGHLQVGGLDLHLTALLLVGSVLGIVLGARIRHKVSSDTLIVILSLLSLGIGGGLMFDNIVKLTQF